MTQLKLAALDEDDLAVVSAHTQDAVMMVGDIRFLSKEQKAIFVMNRFVWDGEAGAENERRRAALSFARVRSMRSSGIPQTMRDTVLELLAIRFEADESPAGTVLLEFAGGGVVALDVECIEARLTDLGAAWSTANRPSHDLD